MCAWDCCGQYNEHADWCLEQQQKLEKYDDLESERILYMNEAQRFMLERDNFKVECAHREMEEHRLKDEVNALKAEHVSRDEMFKIIDADFKRVVRERADWKSRAAKYREALENIRDIAFDGDGIVLAKDLGKDIAGIAQEALKEAEA